MKKWKCVCGYIHDGDEPPAQCPKCGANWREGEEAMKPTAEGVADDLAKHAG